MRTLRSLTTLLLAALVSGGGLVVASPAAACSCAEATLAQHFADADAVFTGSLVSRDVRRLDPWTQSSGDPALLVFDVETVFKGDVHEHQGIVSAADSSACGLDVSGDTAYVVFASRGEGPAEGQYRAGLCNGTVPVGAAVTGELEELAGPATPTPGPPLDGAGGLEAPGVRPLGYHLWLSAGALVLLGAAWRLRRRRPAPAG
jgi:hypothetical protein